LTNQDLEKLVETSDEWIKTRTGIHSRRILRNPDWATSDLGAEAAKKALEAARCSPKEVELIILCTYTPDHVFPATACFVQKKIGAVNAAAFDIETACSGFLYGLTIGAQFIASGTYKRVLVVGAEVNTRILDWKDRNTCIIFGDGAAAALLGPGTEGGELLSWYLGADGSGADLIIQYAGGTRMPTSHETIDKKLHNIHMEGKETFKVAVKVMADSAVEAIKRANLEEKDISLLIPHQANIRIIESCAKRLALPMDRVMVNIDRYGNTAAASVGLALDEALREKRIQKGQNVVLVAFGGGLCWGSACVRWNSIPKFD
jgi:3-oxoacyl-[acyl-carrier-protein] synthase-3